MAKAKKIYAVKVGRETGLFDTWAECQEQVKGYKGAIYKSFKTREDALNFLNEGETGDIPKTVEEELSLTKQYSEDDKYLVVYTDGSNTSVKTKDGNSVLQYAYGFLTVENNKITHEDYGLGQNKEAASLRNVAGELSAVMNAVIYAKNKYPDRDLVIFHDYQGISSWVTGDWKAKNHIVAKYVEFMNKAKQTFDIKFVKVTGHTGNPYNERADFLARCGLGLEDYE